jgi:SNF2 family DNA or RNA helicase
MHYKYKSKPFAHQKKALEMSWDKEVFAYFMEMGTGKSKVLIDNIAMLYNAGKIDSALIIAPKGVYKNWFDSEIPNHLPDYIEKKVGLWRTKPDAPELKPLFSTGAELHILIMNVEAFSTKKGVDFARKFLSSHKAMIGVDESTTIKNPSAKRTKNILSLRTLAKYRRILTGSPVTKSPLDLYSQCQFLDPYLLDQSSYYVFRTRYAICRKINVSGRSVEIVVGYRNLAELSEKIKPFSYRVLKDDCLDLPKKTFVKRTVELTDEQKKVYKQMKEEAIAFLNGKMVTSATVISQLMRLHQITCGHFTSNDGKVQDIKSNRINQLMDILEEMEGKAVIWAHYRYDIQKIVEAISKKYGENTVVTYYGDTSTDDRQKAIKKIQDKDSPVRFIVGTPQTGGYGITLTGASTMIYYSNGYDLEKRQQSEARIDRIGQEKPMTYIDIICENTVDTNIVKSLRNKVNIATEIMGEELKAWI